MRAIICIRTLTAGLFFTAALATAASAADRGYYGGSYGGSYGSWPYQVAQQGAPQGAPQGGWPQQRTGGFKSDVQLRYEAQKRKLDQKARGRKTQSSLPDPFPNAKSMFDGMYMGGQMGMAMSSSKLDYRNGVDSFDQESMGGDGYLFTGYMGIGRSNTKTNLYIGAEADATLSGLSSETDLNGNIIKFDTKYSYFLNARAGYLFSPRSMAYLKAGVGRMHWRVTSSMRLDQNDERFGLLIGGGVEHMIKDQISLRAEFAFTKWDNYSDRAGPEDFGVEPTNMSFSVGASYHF